MLSTPIGLLQIQPRPPLAFSVLFVVSYLIGMCSVLVFGPVRCVAEGLGAAWELAHVGLLPGVRPQVGLQVLQATVGFPTSLELKWFRLLTRVGGQMSDDRMDYCQADCRQEIGNVIITS